MFKAPYMSSRHPPEVALKICVCVLILFVYIRRNSSLFDDGALHLIRRRVQGNLPGLDARALKSLEQ